MLGIVVFACGAFLGFLLTALAPVSAGTWWLWPLVRVIWQVGGGLWCGLGAGEMAGGGRLAFAAGFGLVGALLALNPLLDLARGPLVAEGELVEADIDRYRQAGKGRQSISGQLTLQASDGKRWEIEPVGLQANRLEDLLARCAGPQARLVALRHLDVAIELECR